MVTSSPQSHFGRATTPPLKAKKSVARCMW